ncbi:PEP-CTERM sorting domain-containing protein [Stieleria mannarensis]|uniref:PEP-CTERM sorting domain-containing protein n=1 Tax=Stieleria mannarensis TaxID=2755585 RepID=UPI0016012DA4|nr:PEP-CTERM sorting domain-containing protein [Rhodopirellula sp. JC639]
MLRLPVPNLILAGVLIASTFALPSQRLFAGLITTNIELTNANAADLSVGQELDVTVTLDGLTPSTLAVWMTSIELSDNFSAPSNFIFGGPGGLRMGSASPPPMTVPTSAIAPGYSAAGSSLVGWGLFKPQFSFQTTVIGTGSGLIEVKGALLPVVRIGPNLRLLGSNLIGTTPASLTTFASSPTSLAPPAPGVAAVPEPTSLAVFAALGLVSVYRRRR